jgi:hypothetical protein
MMSLQAFLIAALYLLGWVFLALLAFRLGVL